MEEPEENKNDAFNVNDLGSMNSDKIRQLDKKSLVNRQYLIIGGIALFIIIILIILIVLLTNSLPGKKKEVKGEINCIFFIEHSDSQVQILGIEFNKKSDFSIYIDEIKLDSITKEYKFNDFGEHKIKFELYEDINMEKMFKDVKSIKNVEMTSNKGAKILSLKSTFENCGSLESLNISGFNTDKLESMEKMLCGSNVKNINFNIDTNKIEDMSFMFAGTNIDEESLLNLRLNTNNAKNMSYMFYGCSSLINFNFSLFDTHNVVDMSHMLDSCISLTDVYSDNIDVKNVKNIFSKHHQ